MDFDIKRSDRKTLSIEITRECKILVRAPYFVTDREIRAELEKHSGWIEKNMEKQMLRAENRNLQTDEDKLLLRKKAKAVLPGRVEYFAGLMGVTPTHITVTSAEKRFGSCSAKNALSFSYHLMEYPAEAVDYVVVHELAHIKQHNHSKKFWAEVEKILPDYKKREKLLKK